MRTRILILFAAVFSAAVFLAAQKPEAKKTDLYLLIGQSNMAGRGIPDKETQNLNPNILMLNARNEWVTAADPLHFDFPKAVGVGPGLAFAAEMARKNPGRQIGLIPCAVGGTSIDEWQPGIKPKHTSIYPYDAMLQSVKKAKKYGRIRAILWHQGEQDSNPEAVKSYEQKLALFFQRLRKDLQTPDVPILIGTLADFYIPANPEAATINQIMERYAAATPNVYLVSSAGLTDKGDDVHFDTPSARELGRRYAQTLISIHKKQVH